MTPAGLQDGSLASWEGGSSRPLRRPRNFLSRAEHRKLFWRLMPPAVLLVVTLELLLRPGGPPVPRGEPPVDTRIERVEGPPPAEGGVVIVPSDDSLPTVRDRLSASPRSLGKVRDASAFGRQDVDAWLETFLALRGDAAVSLPPPQPVGFTELFGQPASFRGRLVRMQGTLRRLERLEAPRNDYRIADYWQGWLEPAGGPAVPVVVHFLSLPEGMATGLEIREPVVVDGCFLKNMAYVAGDGVRVAPLLLARAPGRPPASAVDPASGPGDGSLAVVGAVTMLSLVASIAVAFLLVGRGQGRAASADGLDAGLTGIEPVSAADSFRAIATTADGDDQPAGGDGQPVEGVR